MAALPNFSTFSTKAGFAAEHTTAVLSRETSGKVRSGDCSRVSRELRRVARSLRETVHPWHRVLSTRARSVDGSSRKPRRIESRIARKTRGRCHEDTRGLSRDSARVSRVPHAGVSELSREPGVMPLARSRRDHRVEFAWGLLAGNVDAPLVGAHGGALRDEGVGGGDASHLYGACVASR